MFSGLGWCNFFLWKHLHCAEDPRKAWLNWWEELFWLYAWIRQAKSCPVQGFHIPPGAELIHLSLKNRPPLPILYFIEIYCFYHNLNLLPSYWAWALWLFRIVIGIVINPNSRHLLEDVCDLRNSDKVMILLGLLISSEITSRGQIYRQQTTYAGTLLTIRVLPGICVRVCRIRA